ncbi:MAG TPA: ACP S-malonyltransferase [Geothrix sp.]|nr:ACP S-malonyltransferase [Geothrix sp.]
MMHRPSILLFPGQGTEAVGMSKGWEAHETWWRTVEAAEAQTGIPLLRLMMEGPLETLHRQRLAPVAVLAHSVAIYRTWREAGMPLPAAAAGHSMGFYAALVAASVIPLEVALEMISLVEDLCGEAFQDRPMGMGFVIGITELDLRQALLAHPDLVLSCRNGKAQFTISGPLVALLPLLESLRPEALKVGLLPVKHPIHGPHMVALLPSLTRALGKVMPRDPAFPLISHFDGRVIQSGDEAWDEGIASVALPVDWLAVVERLKAMSTPLLECGHGSQLAGLTRWADRDLVVGSLQDPPSAS